MTVGIVGQIGNLEGMRSARVSSARNAEASAEIPFGVMVCRDAANPDTALLLHTSSAAMTASQLLEGVSTHSHSYAEPDELGDDDDGGVVAGNMLGILKEGPIWVLPEESVTPSSDVRVRAVVAGVEVAGAFRATADSTDCVDCTAFCRWLTAGSTTVPALVWVDMANVGLAAADT
jgi:hypothetical protein